MTVRNAGELVDALAKGTAARKRELISISQDLAAPQPTERVRRSAVVLAYAHWEGFVKDAATAYVSMVAHKSRRLADLAPCFQALACRQELRMAQAATRRIAPYMDVVSRVIDRLNESVTLNDSNAIDTESNLNADVFANICACVGVDYHASWSSDGPFMDDLFRTRCVIAHGELYAPDRKYATEVVDFAIGAIDRFSTEIGNAALLKLYLRSDRDP